MAESLVADSLAMLSLRMEFGEKERLTLYRRSELEWIGLGRFSDDIVLRVLTDSRLSGDCVVERAFRQGRFYIFGLPDPSTAEYVQEQRDLGLTAAKARRLGMKSRSYFARGFGPRGSRERDCVLVAESLDPNGLDEESLLLCLDDETCSLLRAIVDLAMHAELMHSSTEQDALASGPSA
ncbi:hypothetical protein [Cellulosimicrobium sp. I38E]|uniref:hypothetical protein n=1 Tax=Cellulosimicrobium sp. I38E TaxID=1393139 RepID=UPI0012E7C857|nr:hypothetical protein [Cellulosimicrobium sp. I38E]